MVPEVSDYDSADREPIEAYLKRWPQELRNFPENVIEQWVHRHNPQFLDEWSSLNIHEWKFECREMTTEEILGIQHLDGELEHWDYVGLKLMPTKDKYQWLSLKMEEQGTFPEPIIVAENAGAVLHPRGREGEYMKAPFQLIEGHRRLGLLRAMHAKKVPSLKARHCVWVVSNVGSQETRAK